jgi:hypothetical protein
MGEQIILLKSNLGISPPAGRNHNAETMVSKIVRRRCPCPFERQESWNVMIVSTVYLAEVNAGHLALEVQIDNLA